MYLIRGGVVSLSVFSVLWLVLSAAVVCGWKIPGVRRRSLSTRPASLYAARVFPLVAALTVVLVFVVPSYLYFEPRDGDEPIGTLAIALASCGALVLLSGLLNAVWAWLKASRLVSAWVAGSASLDIVAGVSAFQMSGPGPALAVAGIGHPKLLVSSHASALLTGDEMRAAMRHELAHIAHRDNLKKLALRFCICPFLAPLERAWLRASEIAADDAASHDESSALELASALIKISRMSLRSPVPELVTSLVAEGDGFIAARVDRLLTWKPRECSRPPRLRMRVPVAVVTIAGVVLTYGAALARLHHLTEILVR